MKINNRFKTKDNYEKDPSVSVSFVEVELVGFVELSIIVAFFIING